ncbi:flagellar hook-length control protein FliK, partial [Leptospira sp. 96542]|nr:flagellar hook-length control protein FliK [Leptospira sp. 96542]
VGCVDGHALRPTLDRAPEEFNRVHGAAELWKAYSTLAPETLTSLLSGLGAEDEGLGTGLLGLDPTQANVSEGFDLAKDVDAAAAVPAFGFDPLRGAGVPAQQDQDPAQTAAAAAAALAALGLDPLAGAASLTPDAQGGSAAALAAMAAAGGVGAINGQPGTTATVPGDGTGVATKNSVALAGGRAGTQQGVDAQLAGRDAAANPRDAALSAKSSELTTLAMEGVGLQRQPSQRNVSARADAAKADALRGAKGEDAAARLGWRSDMAAQVAQAALASGGPQAGLAGEASAGRFGSGMGERGEEGARTTLNEFAAVGAVSSGVTGPAGVDSSNTVYSPAGFTDPALSPETQVAEQVSYWVGRGARNAEISVEGLAENPIHITIAMQGQEAHVAFRADQAETRQVLEDAVPHLRELLEREGLTLADVSVGQSDPGWSGGSEASAQAREQAAHRARLGGLGGRQGEDVAAGPQGAARPMPLPAGRTLDLFV